MPCGDGGQEREDNKVAIRLACLYCKELDRSGRPIPEWAYYWWEDHREIDRRRKEAE